VIVLAAFIAPIVDMGGNTGSQSATLVIRAMALGELKLQWRDVWFIIKRELPVAAALGVVIAVLEAVLAFFAKGVGFDVLMVVGLSMLVCTVLGGIIGALLPFLARRIGTDPATLSSPLITSVMDLLGVFIYFGFDYAFLGDLLTQTVG
jgi:magnesium transporter